MTPPDALDPEPQGQGAPPDGVAPGRTQSAPPVFLQRRSYRRRRMMDAARMVPVAGALLFLVPVLWPQSDAHDGTGASVATSVSYIYLFGLWAGLILLAGVISWSARTWQDEEDREPTPPGGGV